MQGWYGIGRSSSSPKVGDGACNYVRSEIIQKLCWILKLVGSMHGASVTTCKKRCQCTSATYLGWDRFAFGLWLIWHSEPYELLVVVCIPADGLHCFLLYHWEPIFLFSCVGVIVRSLFYLLYWEKDTLYRQSNFSSNLDAAGGGTAVEVSQVDSWREMYWNISAGLYRLTHTCPCVADMVVFLVSLLLLLDVLLRSRHFQFQVWWMLVSLLVMVNLDLFVPLPCLFFPFSGAYGCLIWSPGSTASS